MRPNDAWACFGPYRQPFAARVVGWLDKAWPWLLSGVLFAGMLSAPKLVGLFS